MQLKRKRKNFLKKIAIILKGILIGSHKQREDMSEGIMDKDLLEKKCLLINNRFL